MATQRENNKLLAKTQCELRGQVPEDLIAPLLQWYDKHARILPWRAVKGKKPDPYHVWLSEIMLQQTTVGAVKPYFEKFLDKWPTVQDLADAEQEEVLHEWAGLGYYARARNLYKCAQVVANDLDGIFPEAQKALQALPGIGDYTSAAVRTIAFNKPATVMDGNIERIMARYHALEQPLPKSKPILKSYAAELFEAERERPGDLAQALMDLGATVCIPKAPRCSLCPIAGGCQGRKKDIAADLPKKEKKKASPKKVGHVYWIENDEGDVLLHRRPQKGLLGGMVGLPTSNWVESADKIQHPDFVEDVVDSKRAVHHVFTHFALTLNLNTASAKNHLISDDYYWSFALKPENSGLPSLFQKALKLYLS